MKKKKISRIYPSHCDIRICRHLHAHCFFFSQDIAIEIGFTNPEIKFKWIIHRQVQFKPTHAERMSPIFPNSNIIFDYYKLLLMPYGLIWVPIHRKITSTVSASKHTKTFSHQTLYIPRNHANSSKKKNYSKWKPCDVSKIVCVINYSGSFEQKVHIQQGFLVSLICC